MARQTDFPSDGSAAHSESFGSKGPALVLFAKAPIPGQVKTRLCPPLTPEEAAGLYGAFLRKLLCPLPGTTVFVYGAPAEQLDQLQQYAAPGLQLRPQRGEDLWQRMQNCFDELFAEGYAPVVLRNTDSPDLPVARIEEACSGAMPGRLILGPDTGGGYYLVALGAPVPGLFDGMRDVASADSRSATEQRGGDLGLHVTTLRKEIDVDTFADLLALWQSRLAE